MRSRAIAVLVGGTMVLTLGCGAEREGTLSPSQLPPEFRNRATAGSVLWETYSDALVNGDMDLLEEILGEQFLLQRTNGTWVDKTAYLTNPPRLRSFSSSGYVERRGENVIVLRLDAIGDLSVDGVQYRTVSAPMIAVFDWVGGHWVLQAQGNFNLPGS